jgi:hypothetical protein
VAGLGIAGKKETKLTGGAHASVREERESIEHGRPKPKRKTYFARTPRARGPDGPAEWGCGLRARQASSSELVQIPGEDSSKFWFFEFQGFLKLDRTWRNFTRRFRRNLDMRILPKFL